MIDELEAARSAGKRQAAPFSKGAPTRRPRRPGRKPGAAYGRHGHRAVPAVVHETPMRLRADGVEGYGIYEHLVTEFD